MTLANIRTIAVVWGQQKAQAAIKALSEDEINEAVTALRVAVASGDLTAAAMAEGRIQALDGLSRTFERYANKDEHIGEG